MPDENPINDEEAEIVIGGTSQISANSPPKESREHFLSGANGQVAECIQKTPADYNDLFDLAIARGRKFGPKLFMFAPGPGKNGKPPMSREFVLNVAWPACAAMFGINPAEAVIFEHRPQRPEDKEHLHWHIACHHHDPVKNRSRNWSFDWAKMERFNRTMEVLTGDRVLVGRFQPLVIRTLRKMGENHIADAIEKANPPNAQPAGRTPRREVEQAARRNGINLRDHDKAVRDAYQASTNITELRATLAALGLSLVASYRIPDRPVWTIHNADGFVRSLGGSLPKVSQAAIAAKIGVPEHAEQLDIIDAIAAAGGTGGSGSGLRESRGRDHDVPGPGAGVEEFAGAAPDGAQPGNGEALAGIFVRVVTSFDTKTVKDLEQRADRIMISPLLRAIDYFRTVVRRAKAYLEKVIPAPSSFVLNSRKTRSEMTAELDNTQAAIAEQEGKIGIMKMVPPPEVGRKAHDNRLELETRALVALKRTAALQQQNVDDVARVNKQFEADYAAKVAKAEKNNETNIKIAKRRIRVARRCDALLDAHPEVAPLGAPTLFYKGLKGDFASQHKPNAKWKIETPDEYKPTFRP